MGMGVGEQVRKIELDAYQAFMKVTAVTGMSWVRPATPDPPSRSFARDPHFIFPHLLFAPTSPLLPSGPPRSSPDPSPRPAPDHPPGA